MTVESPVQSPPLRRRIWHTARRMRVIVSIGIVLVAGLIIWTEYPFYKPPVAAVGRFPMTTAAMRTPGHLRVLFLGNSLTAYNGGLAMVLQQMADSAGIYPMPIFDEVTKYGATWAQLWDVTQAPGMVRQGNWDYIVLQDFSTAPMIYRTEMDVYGRRFSQEAKRVGATPVFFMTWPHDDQLAYQQKIAGAYMKVAAANRGLVAPVGYAWQTVLHERPDINLFDPRDHPRKHPTPAGSYLTACVFYSMFFNESPHGLTARIVEGKTVFIDLSEETAEYLQDAAWATVQQMGSLAATRPTTAPSVQLP